MIFLVNMYVSHVYCYSFSCLTNKSSLHNIILMLSREMKQVFLFYSSLLLFLTLQLEHNSSSCRVMHQSIQKHKGKQRSKGRNVVYTRHGSIEVRH